MDVMKGTGSSEAVDEAKQTGPATPLKRVESTVGSIALCAFGTLVLGSLFGAPWPAAVAACGLSVMGIGVSYFMLRRN